MRKVITKDIFRKTWPMIKELCEQHDCSVALAKRKVCEMAEIPYAQEDGFQRVPEYREWKKVFLAKRSGEKRWIK